MCVLVHPMTIHTHTHTCSCKQVLATCGFLIKCLGLKKDLCLGEEAVCVCVECDRCSKMVVEKCVCVCGCGERAGEEPSHISNSCLQNKHTHTRIVHTYTPPPHTLYTRSLPPLLQCGSLFSYFTSSWMSRQCPQEHNNHSHTHRERSHGTLLIWMVF